MESCDVLIVGGGAAGIAAAKAAAEHCRGRILLAERAEAPGGVLLQCAHRGFGPGLTGPETAAALMKDFPPQVELWYNTTVLRITEDRTALLSGRDTGLRQLGFRRLILATGCRERAFGSLGISGTRPRGVYTAGQAQALLNQKGRLPEGPVVILGSGDLGLILAGQLSEAGCSVAALVEQKAQCGGMARNRRCIEQYRIPLVCSSTVSRVCGGAALEGVIIKNLATGEEHYLPCKSLLIAVGYEPERELIRGLEGAEWLRLCGNCREIHPMIENVITEGKTAGYACVT